MVMLDDQERKVVSPTWVVSLNPDHTRGGTVRNVILTHSCPNGHNDWQDCGPCHNNGDDNANHYYCRPCGMWYNHEGTRCARDDHTSIGGSRNS